MKGVAMSTGREMWKEFYVGFLFFLLSFLYLSHFTATAQQQMETEKAVHATTTQEINHG
jgi:hypothetical protein